MIIDIHTHKEDSREALISVSPDKFLPKDGLFYSVGIHPWDSAAENISELFTLLEKALSHPQVLAIGETGLDRLQGAEMSIQEEIFARHCQLSESFKKPMVLHAVRTFDRKEFAAKTFLKMRELESSIKSKQREINDLKKINEDLVKNGPKKHSSTSLTHNC